MMNKTEQPNLYLLAYEEVQNWFLMDSPWPMVTIVAIYLSIVIKFGPEYMKDRKPFDMKTIILCYNVFQIIYNFYMVTWLFTVEGALDYLWNHSCHPLDASINPYYKHLNSAAWYYFLSKVIDLFDTIFFILRKKDSHVTFLHVYHHANMVVSTWLYLRYIHGEQGVICGWMNSVIHTIMYTYYFLAAMGPSVQKYLWWKKYLTKMQIMQFVLVIIYMGSLLLAKCDLPSTFTYFALVQSFVFLALFIHFYIQAYIIKKPATPSKIAYTNGVTDSKIAYTNGVADSKIISNGISNTIHTNGNAMIHNKFE